MTTKLIWWRLLIRWNGQKIPEWSRVATKAVYAQPLAKLKTTPPLQPKASLRRWNEWSSRRSQTSWRRASRSRRQRQPCCTQKAGAWKYPGILNDNLPQYNKECWDRIFSAILWSRKIETVMTWVAHDEKWVFKRPWSPPSKEPVVVASATLWICSTFRTGWELNANQVIVGVEVWSEDKNTRIEAIWPARICTNLCQKKNIIMDQLVTPMVQITIMMDMPGEAENSSLSKSSSQFLRTSVSASRKTALENWVSFQQLICNRGLKLEIRQGDLRYWLVLADWILEVLD